ncbi:MAG: hypothetical protein ACKODH_13835 [Limisphaerales bacterium]
MLGLALVTPECPAPDSVSLRILTETGSRVALEDPLTFNAGTIYQGLSALGHTDKTPRAERTTTDNKAFPGDDGRLVAAASGADSQKHGRPAGRRCDDDPSPPGPDLEGQ